jgi:ankyrin repeat protein
MLHGKRELHFAIVAGDLPRVKLLVRGEASIEGTSESPSALHHAVRNGRTSIVKWLLVEGEANLSDLDRNSKGFTAFLSASFDLHGRVTHDSIKTVQWF